MSYWMQLSEEAAKSFFDYDEAYTDPTSVYWPDFVPQDQYEDLAEVYVEILSNAAGQLESAIEGFLDAVKDGVESKLRAVWEKVVGWDPKEDEHWYSIKDTFSLLGDDFANEESFGARGGVPEYNFLDSALQDLFQNMAFAISEEKDLEWSDVETEDLVPYDLQQDIEKQLMETAQASGEEEWEAVKEDASYLWDEVKKDLKEAMEETEDEY